MLKKRWTDRQSNVYTFVHLTEKGKMEKKKAEKMQESSDTKEIKKLGFAVGIAAFVITPEKLITTQLYWERIVQS